MKYRIELEEKQLHLIAKCLELSTRMYWGKLDTNTLFPLLHEIYSVSSKTHNPDEAYYSMRDRTNDALKDIKDIIWEDLGGDYNEVGHREESDHLYDMYKEIYHTIDKSQKQRLEERGEKYSISVDFNPPRSHTDNPKISVIPLTKEILREESIEDVLKSE
tara:strand:- start:37438 stop:37920 length:483 start_codon:yes stop_codon:yes gene_type:complete